MQYTKNDFKIALARESLEGFTRYTMPGFKPTWFHRQYYEILDLFAAGIIKKLIVTVPPQHGKSEGSTRRLPSYILGKHPDAKMAISSYSTPFARKFNKDIQRIIDSKKYRDVFPETRIGVIEVDGRLLRGTKNADEFEILEHEGDLRAVGRGGALTGITLDWLIIDDLYKDAQEGNSPTVLDAAWDWYVTVANNRLHNDSQQLIVFTRWNEADLVGRLEKKEPVIEIEEIPEEIDPDAWYKINFPAIKETKPTPLDPREPGTPLWPERHSLKNLKRARRLDKAAFESLHQGNPKPREGLMYDSFSTYEQLPEEHRGIYNYTDTADTGQDFLCSVNYIWGLDDKAYILDVLYTDEPMEITEPKTAGMLDHDKVGEADVESNNGGRGFARAVQKLVKKTAVNWFHQSKNKEARIYTASAGVQRDILFPEDWEERWPNFSAAMTTYRKKFSANRHDDAPDAITGVYEKVSNGNMEMSVPDEPVNL
jgi:predicted phage terminase large subunit-like protein